MVVHPPPRIKMGGGMGEARRRELSACQSEDQEERAIQLFGRFHVDAANSVPNAVAAKRDQFVGHDLRPKATTILWGNFDQWSERKSVL
jgi:hypothetical protein